MPVQIWSGPIWWQFVGDTLPEMIFASAWTLLVTFFVQLVGVATGTRTNTSPGIVIQATVRSTSFIDSLNLSTQFSAVIIDISLFDSCSSYRPGSFTLG